ncbi:MAG: hypothetical protein IPK69_08970 [Phycisphaerales bacterium]|nr:MAG: hypothetical protein IPK69_08970 [Phycisphaerales bacterium]
MTTNTATIGTRASEHGGLPNPRVAVGVLAMALAAGALGQATAPGISPKGTSDIAPQTAPGVGIKVGDGVRQLAVPNTDSRLGENYPGSLYRPESSRRAGFSMVGARHHGHGAQASGVPRRPRATSTGFPPRIDRQLWQEWLQNSGPKWMVTAAHDPAMLARLALVDAAWQNDDRRHAMDNAETSATHAGKPLDTTGHPYIIGGGGATLFDRRTLDSLSPEDRAKIARGMQSELRREAVEAEMERLGWVDGKPPAEKTSWQLGIDALKSKRAKEAIEPLLKHVAVHPSDGVGKRLLGVAMLEAGRVNEGIAMILSAYADDPRLALTPLDIEASGLDETRVRTLVSRATQQANSTKQGIAWLAVVMLMQAESTTDSARLDLAEKCLGKAKDHDLDATIAGWMETALDTQRRRMAEENDADKSKSENDMRQHDRK